MVWWIFQCREVLPVLLLAGLFQILDHGLSSSVCIITCSVSKTCVKQPLSKRLEIVSQDQLSLNHGEVNAGQNYCRMLQGEHSATLSTFIQLPFASKIFVLSIFEWSFYTGFTVHHIMVEMAALKSKLFHSRADRNHL